MSPASPYVLDADMMMQAYRSYYAIDLCPGFWNALVQHHGAGSVCSIDKVKAEIDRGKDELATWADAKLPAAMWHSTTSPDVQAAYRQAETWVQSQAQYTQAAKLAWAQGADGWLVALAKTHGWPVVTMEQSAPLSRKDIKIPDVCAGVGVHVINTYEMLRALGVQFN